MNWVIVPLGLQVRNTLLDCYNLLNLVSEVKLQETSRSERSPLAEGCLWCEDDIYDWQCQFTDMVW